MAGYQLLTFKLVLTLCFISKDNVMLGNASSMSFC